MPGSEFRGYPGLLKGSRKRTLSEYNEIVFDEYDKTRGPGCLTGVLCPSCDIAGERTEMAFASNVVLSNAGNIPPRREVACPSCGRKGRMLI